MSGIFGTTEVQTVDDPIEILQPGSKPQPPVYGINGNIANSPRNFSYPEFRNAVTSLTRLIRVPGGSVDFNILNETYPATGQTNCLADIAQLGIDVLFRLDMVNFTVADYVSYLGWARSLGIKITRLELGNEYNNKSNPARLKFKTATEYFNEARKWIDQLKTVFPDAKFGCVGENKQYGTRRENTDVARWNETGNRICPDAKLIWHLYPLLGNCTDSQGNIDLRALEQEILYEYRLAGFDKQTSFWVTEFGLKPDTKDYEDIYVSDESQKAAVKFIADKLKSFGAEVICLHNITTIFDISKNSLTLTPLAEGFKSIVQ